MPYTPSTTPLGDIRPSAYSPIGSNGIASEAEMYTIYQRPVQQQFDLFARHARLAPFSVMLRAMGFSRMCSVQQPGHCFFMVSHIAKAVCRKLDELLELLLGHTRDNQQPSRGEDLGRFRD